MLVLGALFGISQPVYAVDVEDFILKETDKIAYLTFDDGPSIYTEKLVDILNVHGVPGIFFVLGKQLDHIPDANRLLKRLADEGHHIALHTMTHDKNALYFSEKSPSLFKEEMLTLKNEIKLRTGHETNLCRAPYGKHGHFKIAHHKAVEDAGLYCVDWHVDSKDWAKKNASQIYDEVARQLKDASDQDEIVLLFHEYQRTVDALPAIIELLKAHGYGFEPYVEGKTFKGLD